MKALLSIVCMLGALSLHAQDFEHQLFAENYVHVRFSCYKKDQWPVFFDAVLKSDSLSVNIENLDEFVTSLYSAAAFVPMSTDIHLDAFAKVFRSSKYDRQLYSDVNFFMNDYYAQFDRFAKRGEIKLATGHVLKYLYINIRGVFSEIDKAKCGMYDTSNGIEFSRVNKIIVPIAISNCKEAEKDLVVIAHIHK